jgi:subtilisin family serine protease
VPAHTGQDVDASTPPTPEDAAAATIESHQAAEAKAIDLLNNNETADFIVIYKVTSEDVDAVASVIAAEASQPGVAAASAADDDAPDAGAAPDGGAAPDAAAPGDAKEKRKLRRQARLRAQADVKDKVMARRAASHAAATSAPGAAARRMKRRAAKVKKDFDQLPVALLSINSVADLEELKSDPLVLSIQPNRRVRLMDRMSVGELLSHGRRLRMAQSLPVISQPQAAAAGFLGAGCGVAVIDTGADYTLPDLGSCTAPGLPASTCRVWATRDIAANDNALDDFGHGSNVASIVAKVAPGAKILALDVFTRDSTGWSAAESDIIGGIQWAMANQATYNICSINLSLGGASPFTSYCTDAPMGVAITEARRAGILSAVAAGNDAQTTGLSTPACSAAAVSVGATYDSDMGRKAWTACTDATTAVDKICCFSNSASYLTMLAPGAMITAGERTYGGTSQAAPHVAGGWAAAGFLVPAAAGFEPILLLVV